jgi:hypothetical protein
MLTIHHLSENHHYHLPSVCWCSLPFTECCHNQMKSVSLVIGILHGLDPNDQTTSGLFVICHSSRKPWECSCISTSDQLWTIPIWLSPQHITETALVKVIISFSVQLIQVYFLSSSSLTWPPLFDFVSHLLLMDHLASIEVGGDCVWVNCLLLCRQAHSVHIQN